MKIGEERMEVDRQTNSYREKERESGRDREREIVKEKERYMEVK